MRVTRRDFFRFGSREAVRTVATGLERTGRLLAAREKRLPAFLRPPGALAEEEFLAACTACKDCVTACPKAAIRSAGPEIGGRVEGTPVILPETNPCWLCKELPCIATCEPGALRPVAAPEDVRIGLARVVERQCWAASGNICEVCGERCPVRPKAIHVIQGQAAAVSTSECTGCGVCAYLCPADAIRIEPPHAGE